MQMYVKVFEGFPLNSVLFVLVKYDDPCYIYIIYIYISPGLAIRCGFYMMYDISEYTSMPPPI